MSQSEVYPLEIYEYNMVLMPNINESATLQGPGPDMNFPVRSNDFPSDNSGIITGKDQMLNYNTSPSRVIHVSKQVPYEFNYYDNDPENMPVEESINNREPTNWEVQNINGLESEIEQVAYEYSYCLENVQVEEYIDDGQLTDGEVQNTKNLESEQLSFEVIPEATSAINNGVPSTIIELDDRYNFDIKVDESIYYSKKLNKIFVKPNQEFFLQTTFERPETQLDNNLNLRIYASYTADINKDEPIKSCENHRGRKNDSLHFIHYVDKEQRKKIKKLGDVEYLGSPESVDHADRLGIIFPLKRTRGNFAKYDICLKSTICTNTCLFNYVKGKEKQASRNVALFCTLEMDKIENGRKTTQIVGKKIINYKVCANPKRDITKEDPEMKIKPEIKDNNGGVKKGNKRKQVSVASHKKKVPKLEKLYNNNGIVVQIHLPEKSMIKEVCEFALGLISKEMMKNVDLQTAYKPHWDKLQQQIDDNENE